MSLLAVAQAQELDTFRLISGLLGGLAIFLFGMEMMANALKAVAGERMRNILGRLTKNRFMGALTGAAVTAVIQSSSVTTVLVVGFISAGLMSMAQSIGVILGAHIGTTVTAQIIAFKVTEYALPMIAVGFGLTFLGKRENLRHHGAGIMGLGLVFLGMVVMADAMSPLRDYQPFLDWMARMERPLFGILAAGLFTALIQSSSATIGVVIVMASQGFVTLTAGIALIFGANIGTSVTAILAAIGKPREAQRAAAAHVGIQIVGVLIWLPFIGLLATLTTQVSPSASGLTGVARLASETPRQIANAHTIFNVANTLLLIWFTPQIARIVQRLIPDRPISEEEEIRARYLDDELLATPSFALDRARLEILHLGDLVREMLTLILPAVTSGDREALHRVEAMDDGVDVLHGHVITYLGKISQGTITEEQTRDFVALMEAANDLENIGDIIERNLVGLGHRRIEDQVQISESTLEVIRDFHRAVVRSFEYATQSVTQKNRDAALQVIGMKSEINRLADSAALHEARRLVASEPNRLEAYALETDILENLKRIYYFCKRMARGVMPESVGVAED